MVSWWRPLWYLRIVWALRWVTITGSFPLYTPRSIARNVAVGGGGGIHQRPERVWHRQAWNNVLKLCAATAAADSSESPFELDGDDDTTAIPLAVEMASIPSTRNVSAAPDNDSSRCCSPSSVVIHHTALQTRNITTAILFYTTLLDFQVECRFRAGPARAAWLQQQSPSSSSSSSSSSRLELIEVPPYLWPSSSSDRGGTRLPRAPDILTQYPTWLGYHHLALDVTSSVRAFKEKQISSGGINDTMALLNGSDTSVLLGRRPHLWLQDWLEVELQRKSQALYHKTIRVAVPPRQQIIGTAVYELAWIYDADGCLVELLYQSGPTTTTLRSSTTDALSGWEPWNGTNFQQ
jgi:catechol 2,3-dioxygenase-like lactoylglutathione lyase family enzyme